MARDYIYAGGRVIAVVKKHNASNTSYGVTLTPQQLLLDQQQCAASSKDVLSPAADGVMPLWHTQTC